MKTSFYFVLWILIYPVLGMFHSSALQNNAFLVALIVVFGISWLLNKLMPETIIYEGIGRVAPILEDVYTDNVASFKKRLGRTAALESVTALYFSVTTAVLLMLMFSGVRDFLGLVIFGLFAFSAVKNSVTLVGAYFSLKSDPTPDRTVEIVEDVYHLDYTSYYNKRIAGDYEQMLPPRPRCYKVFQVVSILFALASFVLGLIYMVKAVNYLTVSGVEVRAIGSMYMLYGSLAMLFGAKDMFSSWNTMKRSPLAGKSK